MIIKMDKSKKSLSYSYQRGDWVEMMKYIGRYGKDKGYYEKYASQKEIDECENYKLIGLLIALLILIASIIANYVSNYPCIDIYKGIF
jgi:hypothetical protein